jgi:hypothetical protein
MSSVAPPHHQCEANPTDRPSYETKTHLRRLLQRHVMPIPFRSCMEAPRPPRSRKSLRLSDSAWVAGVLLMRGLLACEQSMDPLHAARHVRLRLVATEVRDESTWGYQTFGQNHQGDAFGMDEDGSGQTAGANPNSRPNPFWYSTMWKSCGAKEYWLAGAIPNSRANPAWYCTMRKTCGVEKYWLVGADGAAVAPDAIALGEE